MPEIEIRDNPKLRSFFRNVTEMTFTGFAWGVWVYLLLPVVNFVLWILGLRYINFAVLEQIGYKEFVDLMSKIGWSILIVFLILRLWGYYNYVRFGKQSKRKVTPLTTIEQLAEHYHIPVDDVRRMRSEKEVIWRYPSDVS